MIKKIIISIFAIIGAIASAAYISRAVFDTSDYSMPTTFTVTSVEYHPGHSQPGTMMVGKILMPHTYYISQYWTICGNYIIEGGPRADCFDIRNDPGKAVGLEFPAKYGFTRFSHKLRTKIGE